MTRAHVRLLGPCFKTGRVGRPVVSAANRRRPLPEKSPSRQRRPARGGQVRTTGNATGRSQEARARDREVPRADSLRSTAEQSVGTPGLRAAANRDPGSHPGLRPTPSGSRRPTRGEVRSTSRARDVPRARDHPEGRSQVVPATRSGSEDWILNLPVRPLGLHPFTPERFHVLLNSLFKVLFNFPSRYLFAIGLVVVFSLRWSLPPA